MDEEDILTNRILSAEAGIDSQAFRTGALRAEDWEYLALATEKLHDAPIYMDDTSGITITEMKAKIRRVNQDPTRPNVGLIVIDYLQLMTTGQRSENRVQEISSITRNLKIMAKEMNVPIIALSQLSRAVEKQGNNSSHRPQLSDLRDSGSMWLTWQTVRAMPFSSASGRMRQSRAMLSAPPETASARCFLPSSSFSRAQKPRTVCKISS